MIFAIDSNRQNCYNENVNGFLEARVKKFDMVFNENWLKKDLLMMKNSSYICAGIGGAFLVVSILLSFINISFFAVPFVFAMAFLIIPLFILLGRVWYLKTYARKVAFDQDFIRVLDHKGSLMYKIPNSLISKIDIRTGFVADRSSNRRKEYVAYPFIVMFVGVGHEYDIGYEFNYVDYCNNKNFIVMMKNMDIVRIVRENFDSEIVEI